MRSEVHLFKSCENRTLTFAVFGPMSLLAALEALAGAEGLASRLHLLLPLQPLVSERSSTVHPQIAIETCSRS